MPSINGWNNQVLDANVTFNGGTMNIGSDATDNAINIGTSANAGRTVTIGNIVGTTGVNFNTGTSGSIFTTINGEFRLVTGTGNINLGTDGVAKGITIGNQTGVTAVEVNTGTTGFAVFSNNGQVVIESGTAAIDIGTDAVQKTITIGNGTGNTGVAVNCGTNGASFGATNNLHTTTIGTANTNSVTTINSGAGGINLTGANGDITLHSGSGTIYVGNDAVQHGVIIGNATGTTSVTVDCGTNGASFGASATVHTTTVGSVTGASATTLQSGSGALNVTATGGALTINSGVGALSISNDASATTVNIASGAAAKVVQLGSTNGASSLALKYGTADFTLASATGTTMSVLDTGEMTMPLQPAFLAANSAADLNATGDGTAVNPVDFDTEIFDNNGDFAADVFTAPVTGRYNLSSVVLLSFSGVGDTASISIVTSNRTYVEGGLNNTTVATAGDFCGLFGFCLADMDAGDTAQISCAVSGGAKTVGIFGNAGPGVWTFFQGYLVC